MEHAGVCLIWEVYLINIAWIYLCGVKGGSASIPGLKLRGHPALPLHPARIKVENGMPVRSENIHLSKTTPLQSRKNILSGCIRTVRQTGSIVRICVDAGNSV